MLLRGRPATCGIRTTCARFPHSLVPALLVTAAIARVVIPEGMRQEEPITVTGIARTFTRGKRIKRLAIVAGGRTAGFRRFLRTGLPESPSQSLYPKVIELFAGSKLRPQPTRLFSPTSPRLRRILRVSIFWENLRVGVPLLFPRAISRAQFV